MSTRISKEKSTKSVMGMLTHLSKRGFDCLAHRVQYVRALARACSPKIVEHFKEVKATIRHPEQEASQPPFLFSNILLDTVKPPLALLLVKNRSTSLQQQNT
jgi:hypothetical protein